MRIRYYLTAGGANPVAKYIADLSTGEKAAIIAALTDIERHGLHAQVAFRPIEGKLWEIKIGRQRVFYVLIAGPEMVLLHAYNKQSQKAPQRELDVARKRLSEVLG